MVFGIHLMIGQTTELNGHIVANDEVEGIHILNSTSRHFTISNSKGQFSIPVNLQDTLTFSGVSYELTKIVVSQQMIRSKSLTVYLTEKINILDEVVVGKILTGDLNSDLANSGIGRDINFYDFGIPGFKGKPKTQSERKLYDADHGKYVNYTGLAVSINVNKILNKVTGRTKMLAHRVFLETKDKCINKTKSDLAEILFSAHPLDESYRNEFFYYCADDAQFDSICIISDDFKTLEFLKDKLVSFKSNLQSQVEE